MTTEDPNVTTTPEGETVLLEPGDPGYVEPEQGEVLAPPLEGPEGPEAVASPQDLTWQKEPGETDAEFMDRTRGVVVDSQHPSDIVPNTPQIRPFPETVPEIVSPEGGLVEPANAPEEEEVVL